MKRNRAVIFLGIGLICCGLLLLWIGTEKKISVTVNGESRIIRTHRLRTADILKGAKIPFTAEDRIRPGLTAVIRDGGKITLDRAVSVELSTNNDTEPLRFLSWQHFGGNILLDAGLRLYPGDRLSWNGTDLQPAFNLAGVSDLKLSLERADTFTLITENDPNGRTAYGKGATVTEALLSAGVILNKSSLIFPDGGSAFTPGMTIEVLPLRELKISSGGKLFSVASAGSDVGEALARAGMPLMGSAVSLPAASEPIPPDGRILIVPVSDSFSINAEVIRRQTDWSASEELELDSTRLTAEGQDGLRGSFTRVRVENGETVLNETSPESTLIPAVNDQREYGTRIITRTLDTPDGPVEYYRSVKVYATSYSPCRSGTSSCITGTASGMKAGKGIAAVTSSWYNHFGGQSVYIPDYGKAVIADVGGGIPGRYWIDLAYDDDNFVSWSKETTLYFLTPVPADMVWVLQ